MVNNSPRYGPKGYGNNKMPRWMKLLLEAAKKSVVRTPESHRLRTPTTRAKRVRRVKARPRSLSK